MESLLLGLCTVSNPVPIAKHKDIRSDRPIALGALWNRFSLKGFRAYVYLVNIGVKNVPAIRALKVHDTSMTLSDLITLEARFAKMVVYVAREHKVVSLHVLLADLEHIMKA